MSDFKVCTHCEKSKRRDDFKAENHVCNDCLQDAGTINIARPLKPNELSMIEDFKKKKQQAS